MQNLQKQRAIHRMTLKQLGNAVGVSAVTISRYEKGEREPNIDKLKKLSTALGITVDELISEGENDDTVSDHQGRS